MEPSKETLKNLAYQLVQERGGGDQARAEAQQQGDQGLIAWSFLNLPTVEKAKATLEVLAARDMERSMARLSQSIDKFNDDSGKLYKAYLWLTFAIAIATIVNTLVAVGQALHFSVR